MTRSSNYGRLALLDAIPRKVKTRQCEKWQAMGQDFITDVLARFEEFARILQELLENDTCTSDAHKRVRKALSKQLPAFNYALAEAKSQFPESEVQRPAKKARKSKVKTEVDSS
ncbi:uncharacterized protein EKO05_0000911 [Ascochyta rabiei]|nr:uncharacterized protein EKO05_0000911 [Ascochyta rabiei]UPX10243.1 hypothetical protein EKO05_0000911 [Ascochyta rabiei]